jgi:hypothetical protein
MMPSADKIGEVNDHAPANGSIRFYVRAKNTSGTAAFPCSKEANWSSFSGETGCVIAVSQIGHLNVPRTFGISRENLDIHKGSQQAVVNRRVC